MSTVPTYLDVGIEATFEHQWVTKTELRDLGASGWEAVCMDGGKVLVKRRRRRMTSVVTAPIRRQTGGNI
jgi:hypothetical protein